MWVPQIPGYPTITIGGAIASNSHGKSCGFHGTIKKQIKRIKIFHKIHGWLNLSNDENKDIFDLTIGGFGLTGSIVEVQIKLEQLSGNNFTTRINETTSSKDTVKKMNFDKVSKKDKKRVLTSDEFFKTNNSKEYWSFRPKKNSKFQSSYNWYGRVRLPSCRIFN